MIRVIVNYFRVIILFLVLTVTVLIESFEFDEFSTFTIWVGKCEKLGFIDRKLRDTIEENAIDLLIHIQLEIVRILLLLGGNSYIRGITKIEIVSYLLIIK